MNLRFAPANAYPPYINQQSLNYAYGKINGLIISDIDNNGFIDIVTFPSAFEFPTAYSPVVWGNRAGSFRYAPELLSLNGLEVQYIRDSVSGDFNRDGDKDFFILDQGWELNSRNPLYFFGNYPSLLTGSAQRLESRDLQSWMEPVSLRKTFNHIGDTADYDSDGDLDLIIASFWELRLLENLGNGKFTWLRDSVPSVLNNDLSKAPSVSNPAPEQASGATFIKLRDDYAIAVGHYRAYSNEDLINVLPPKVLVKEKGEFTVGFELPRPNLGGREVNYGAADMYNIDLNADGLEDLLILWEGEAVGGVDDGQSLILDSVYGGTKTRYADLSDNILTIYFQDSSGKLNLDSKYYQMSGTGSGFHVYFDDLNLDGYIDIWNSSYGLAPQDFYKNIWLNTGSSGFVNPAASAISFQDKFSDWYIATPLFIDANSDGTLDLVSLEPSFGTDYDVRNIGEQLKVYLNEDVATPRKKLNYLSSDFSLEKMPSGALRIEGLGIELTWFNIERLAFLDVSVAFDTKNVAGKAYRIYKAAFDRTPDGGGLGYWIAQMDKGMDVVEVAARFIDSPEFRSLYGTNPSNAEFLTEVYSNVLDRTPDEAGLAWWVNEMKTNPAKSWQKVLADFSESTENQANVASLIANGIPFDPWVG
jgi:hypothetical protein